MNTFVLDTIYKIRNYRMCRVEHWQGLYLFSAKSLNALLTQQSDA